VRRDCSSPTSFGGFALGFGCSPGFDDGGYSARQVLQHVTSRWGVGVLARKVERGGESRWILAGGPQSSRICIFHNLSTFCDPPLSIPWE
jgi:hypothetical protein